MDIKSKQTSSYKNLIVFLILVVFIVMFSAFLMFRQQQKIQELSQKIDEDSKIIEEKNETAKELAAQMAALMESLKKPTAFSYSNIESITTSANVTSESTFPDGLFSYNPMDWGLKTKESGPITLNIKFKNPTILKAITPKFGYCGNLDNHDCYEWQVTGITSEGQEEDIIPITIGNYRKDVLSNSSFSAIQMTISAKPSQDSNGAAKTNIIEINKLGIN